MNAAAHTFREAIAVQCLDGYCGFTDPRQVYDEDSLREADLILAMPEMQAIKKALNLLAVAGGLEHRMWFSDYLLSIGLPQNVIDWVERP